MTEDKKATRVRHGKKSAREIQKLNSAVSRLKEWRVRMLKGSPITLLINLADNDFEKYTEEEEIVRLVEYQRNYLFPTALWLHTVKEEEASEIFNKKLAEISEELKSRIVAMRAGEVREFAAGETKHGRGLYVEYTDTSSILEDEIKAALKHIENTREASSKEWTEIEQLKSETKRLIASLQKL